MIFTIGYSTRTLPEFVVELQKRSITQLWDVRSSPWSRNAPFNANQIERWSEASGIMYKQCGTVLGGRADIPLSDPVYLAALDQIVDAASQEPVVLMCSEGDPTQCHRTWDIGASLLLRYGVIVRNILRNGREEDITETIKQVRKSNFDQQILHDLERNVSLF